MRRWHCLTQPFWATLMAQFDHTAFARFSSWGLWAVQKVQEADFLWLLSRALCFQTLVCLGPPPRWQAAVNQKQATTLLPTSFPLLEYQWSVGEFDKHLKQTSSDLTQRFQQVYDWGNLNDCGRWQLLDCWFGHSVSCAAIHNQFWNSFFLKVLERTSYDNTEISTWSCWLLKLR